MDSLKYILGNPECIEGICEIYPIKLKYYDEFAQCSGILSYSKKHLQVEEQPNPLLDFLVFGFKDENIVKHLEKLFSLVLKKEVFFIFENEKYAFIADENSIIHSGNYDQLREIIMKQNLLFEPKVWKDPLVAQYAKMVLETRSKNSVKMTIEDMVTTVAMFSGKSYEEISEFTIYQLKASFDRVDKLKSYDTTVAFKCVGVDVLLGHYAEQLNMFEDPYKDIFKSKGSKLGDALGNKGL